MLNCFSCVQLFVTLCTLQPLAQLLCPWDSPVKNTRVGCHFLLQEIFPTQGSNPRSPMFQADSLPSEPPGKDSSEAGIRVPAGQSLRSSVRTQHSGKSHLLEVCGGTGAE